MKIKLLYKAKEVAELLDVDVQTVRKYVREGKMEGILFGKRNLRIPYKAIEYLLPKGDK